MAAQIQTHPPLTAISQNEVDFHPHSFADDVGRLFRFKGDLYRAISSDQASFYRRLFDEGLIDRLAQRGLLIPTRQTGMTLDGYGMVVRHQTVSFASYPNEWCSPMLRDAALTIIDLVIELGERGLTLKDAHPWNVLFDGCRPVYVDLTSIVPLTDKTCWTAYDEFCRFCYYPLVLMSCGHERIARALLPEVHGVLRQEVLTILRGSGSSRFILSRLFDRALSPIRTLLSNEDYQPFLRRIRRRIEGLRLTETRPLSSDAGMEFSYLQRVVDRVLNELKPDDVFDVSRGDIWTSVVPARRGSTVVSVSPSSGRAARTYMIGKKEKLPLLPLVIDFIKPTPSVGYSGHYSIAASERLKCDLVLALGLMPDVMANNHFNSDLVAEGLAAFSRRWVLLDFVTGFVSLDTFMEALRKRFSYVRILKCNLDQPALLLCEK